MTPTFPRSPEADEFCLEIVTGFALFARKGEGDDGVEGVEGEFGSGSVCGHDVGLYGSMQVCCWRHEEAYA